MEVAQTRRATLAIPPTVISFRGPLGCGKTTAALYLAQNYSNVVKISFADALKKEVFAAFWTGDMPPQVVTHFGFSSLYELRWGLLPACDFPGRALMEIKGDEQIAWVNKHKLKLRAVLQYWGTEYRRAQDENYWFDKFVNAARYALNEGYTVVVDDARFPNERAAIKDILGGYEIYLDSTEDYQLARDGTAAKGIAGHASEAYNDPKDPDIDFIVRNDPPVERLYDKIELIVRDWIGSKNFNPVRMGQQKGSLTIA